MINGYTMKQIEFGFTSEYKVGDFNNFKNIISNLKNEVAQAKAMPSSRNPIQTLDDFRR